MERCWQPGPPSTTPASADVTSQDDSEPGHDRRVEAGLDLDATESAAPVDPGPRSLPGSSRVLLLAGVLMIGAVAWSLATGWVGLTGSHPIGWITNVVTALAGIGLLARALRAGPGRQVPGWRRWSVRIAAALIVVLLTGVVVYTRPLSAEQVALDAIADGDGVEISDGATSLTMQPTEPARTGLVFYPGAKVDPRAYTRLLRPLAEAGYPVVIAKQPYNLAILDIDAAERWIGATDDEVDRWVVGGHSLGGAMAASYASDERPELVGLLLYAAYPAGDLSDRDVAVLSVSGTNDGLSTPDKIADSVADLPATTELVTVEGAIHAFFGDYGSQRGDGEPGVDRETAQRDIVAATLAFLERVDADG